VRTTVHNYPFHGDPHTRKVYLYSRHVFASLSLIVATGKVNPRICGRLNRSQVRRKIRSKWLCISVGQIEVFQVRVLGRRSGAPQPAAFCKMGMAMSAAWGGEVRCGWKGVSSRQMAHSCLTLARTHKKL